MTESPKTRDGATATPKGCGAGGINLALALPHPPILVAGIGSHADHALAHASIVACREAADCAVGAAPELVVIATPHGRLLADCFLVASGARASGDWTSFGRDPERYELSHDEEFVSALLAETSRAGVPCVARADAQLDHGVMVPLHFLLGAGLDQENCRFVRVSVSHLDTSAHFRLGACIQAVARGLGRRAVFVASGDLSHRLKEDGPYGFAPEGPLFDASVTEALASGDLARLRGYSSDFRSKAGECGLNSLVIMSGVFEGSVVDARLYSYECPWGVGYGVARFLRGAARVGAARPEAEEGHAETTRPEAEKGHAEEHPEASASQPRPGLPVRLALASLRHYLQCGELPTPHTPSLASLITESLTSSLAAERELATSLASQQAGVFVSFKKHGELRGCIGTIAPACSSVIHEICRNAVSAGTEDPRFMPVQASEL
ncbi:MAG: AMMECR1 domain-containing protein, partial [Coriobacteriales bacterium]|nr:AMMECR1 domain-containing protein [Coriobacteriales bacterium]